MSTVEIIFMIILIGVGVICLLDLIVIDPLMELISRAMTKKAKRLYPEFFNLLTQRDYIKIVEWKEASKREKAFKYKIDEIREQLPYTPIEEINEKNMEIEVYKKKMLRAKTERVQYEIEMDRLTNQINKMAEGSKLLRKLDY